MNNVYKIMMGLMLTASVLTSTAAMANRECYIQFTIDQQSEKSAEFNYLIDGRLAGTLDRPIHPGNQVDQRVECSFVDIFATPMSKPSIANAAMTKSAKVQQELGRCSYRGNSVELNPNSGISVVFPQDFQCN